MSTGRRPDPAPTPPGSAGGIPPSGAQYPITHGDQHATVVEVGGGIRAYEVGGRDVLQPYALDQMCDGAHGAPLVPWPNRLGDGRYRFDGEDHQVPLTEPEKGNAIHGFLRWQPWSCVTHEEGHVVMGTTLFPRPGYPFTLGVRVGYRLDDEGLSVTTSATNLGDRPAPYACGQHPYLAPADGLVDDCTLRLEASTRILTDPQRQLPTGREDVTGTAYDFREGRRLGDLAVDDAFTDLRRDERGRAWVSLESADGEVVGLWVDRAYPVVEIFTGDTLAPDRRRRGLGAEPMTGPPNAFQSGIGVARLDPGDTFRATWGVSLARRGDGGARRA
ncbi:aldose 1-epimerase family protein [Phycicoccus duodecadis]|uniref:Aldose 1-epimerase n=1 Tax=Phycicoccus duodecadis TaxID=173053 RepID=A0A2N3YK87_9MICO|nr:aldose 1-epimerase family protein [Phycicoccus duodecadis]PKW27271.1 aldose 1-epimerase [Phycicoccus duodecadis]